ncbi:hypothetical protein PAXRUDRAFT_19593 [Paxillus rubicundulus Ve08.2h10]|uniref:Uncharacterized protein n=1 Tax=Paxillus rubicundulus Ve08.2h10 TaxID=930991 RepID=A0A0D0BTH3_9AGAM|nr:hypothetical protein PAXRUDRAFT_19593 [Paxillus rubicundulus Ve08.2h10]
MALPTALRLTLPMNVVTSLLPESTLSVLDFLKFPLPPPEILSNPSPSMYFSSNKPNIQDIQKINSKPTPPDIVNTLLSHTTKSATLSVQCAHYGYQSNV